MKFEVAPKETEIQANWDDAKLYCLFLNIDGVVGWRLPTKDELDLIYKDDNDFSEDWYWTSTKFSADYVWFQYFGNAYQGHTAKTFRYNIVRAIRDIKSTESD
jgi:hypothetical protein